MEMASGKIQHTNYISNNPLFRILLKNFLNRVSDLLRSINAGEKHGLDAGCGEGHMLRYFKENGVINRITAIDISKDSISLARTQIPELYYNIADLCHLPFPNESFDFVISTEVFEHLPHPQKAMMELKRIAKPSAHLIISVPFEPFFHWGNLIRGKYWSRFGYTPDHRNFWHRHQFIKFLSSTVKIDVEYNVKTFPWLLYGCRFR